MAFAGSSHYPSRVFLILLSIGTHAAFQPRRWSWAFVRPHRIEYHTPQLSLPQQRHQKSGTMRVQRPQEQYKDDNSNNGNDEGLRSDPDLFDYFDPLLSPHAYPNGISPDHSPLAGQARRETISSSSTRYSRRIGFLLDDDHEPKAQSRNVDSDSLASKNTSPNVFDPLLSPHAYPNGVPDVVIGYEHATSTSTATTTTTTTTVKDSDRESPSSNPLEDKRRVGILLIDHGSRNSESNERLHELAKAYQKEYGSSQTLVRAAHMEIAQPSIPNALQAMILEARKSGDPTCTLDEIICHPFFLSPMGRHVSEDIPRIIDEAKQNLSIDIPITITKPVGSETAIIMTAMHSLIQQSTATTAARR